jgi:two-component system, NarL family, nitrate/nitrite response regulator NarL
MVVDDHPVVRDGLSSLADGSPSIRIVGYAATGAEAVASVKSLAPDVILLDLRLPDQLAPELTSILRAMVPTARIVLFTAFPDHPAVEAALAAGAHGLLPKDASRTDLITAITRAARGESVDAFTPLHGELRHANNSVIARREYDVLRRVATGETNIEIAEAMGLTRNTVKAYLQSAMHKLGARNRVEAISRARERGLL